MMAVLPLLTNILRQKHMHTCRSGSRVGVRDSGRKFPVAPRACDAISAHETHADPEFWHDHVANISENTKQA